MERWTIFLEGKNNVKIFNFPKIKLNQIQF